MRKRIRIDGMMCEGCSGRISKLLNALDGVTADVRLAENDAIVDLADGVEDQLLADTISNAGYKVVAIEAL